MEDTSDIEDSTKQWPFAMWAQWPMAEELLDDLMDACGGDPEETEAYAAFFRQFADAKEWYTAAQVQQLGENAHSIRYPDWEAAGDHWLFDHDNQAIIDTLLGVADSDQKTVVHELVAQLGRKYAPRESEWWYETNLLADGDIFVFNRP